MKAILICPERRAVASLAVRQPLVLLSLCGKTLLDHALTFLADYGVQEVRVLASDRPDRIRRALGRGEKWGLKIEVIAERDELTPAEAALKYQAGDETGRSASSSEVFVLDRLPQRPDQPLFDSYECWFRAAQAWLPTAAKERVGAHEVAPGVWCGLRSQLSSQAQFYAPCWIGDNVWIQAGATVGPNVIVEDGAVIDERAALSDSIVGPSTYVGAMTAMRGSIAAGRTLINWRTASATEITDAFLLSDLRERQSGAFRSSWFGRWVALVTCVVTSPVLACAWLRSRSSGGPLFVSKLAVAPQRIVHSFAAPSVRYRELNGVSGLLKRWPQLWNIVRGEFTWVGNRPLDEAQATRLTTEFEQLWLAAPVGLFSLADSLQCGDEFSEDARAHASYYATHASSRQNFAILGQMLRRLCLPSVQNPKLDTTYADTK